MTEGVYNLSDKSHLDVNSYLSLMSQSMNGMSSSRTLLGFGSPPFHFLVIIEVRKFCVQIVYIVIGPPSEGFYSIK